MSATDGPSPTSASSWRLRWVVAVGVWSLIFAAPHFYWAVGGRAGLGAQAAAADAALRQGWFAAYNLAAGSLAVLGVVVALTLSYGSGGQRLRRWLLIAAAVAAAALLLRGLLGLTLLAVDLLRGTLGEEVPPVLLAIEPWFVLGGLVYGGMVVHHSRNRPSSLSR